MRRSGESTSPPVSLQNDQRQEFHKEEDVERDLLVQGIKFIDILSANSP